VAHQHAGHGDEHDQPHGEGLRRSLIFGLAVTAAFVVIEAVAGFVAGSLALVSDAGHTLADSAGLILALAAATMARRPADSRRTYGYARFEVLAVPVHVTLLLGIAAYILWESVSRFGGGHDVDAGPVIVVGLAGLAVNLAVMGLLHRHAHDNLNARAASIEAAADALSSVAVVVSGVVIALGGWQGVDALVGVGIVLFILPRAFMLLRQAADVLLESAPAGLNPDEIVAASRSVPGVVALHDVHVWSIGSRFPALSAHVEIRDVASTERVLTSLATLMQERFNIRHVTLQPETEALHEAMACCLSPDAALLPVHGHSGD
jgi:cobalt-zinc-cadmium efflux system protein